MENPSSVAEWVKSNFIVVVMIAGIIAAIIYGYGRLEGRVEDLAEAEARIEARQIEMLERLSRLEGRISVKGE